MTRSLDNYLSGRYQACAINYNDHLKKLFGKRYGVDEQLTYSIQFVKLSEEQIAGAKPEATIPERLRAYVATFDAGLSHEEYNSERYVLSLCLFHRGRLEVFCDARDSMSRIGPSGGVMWDGGIAR